MCVVLSVARSVFCWLWLVFRINRDKAVVKYIKHFKSSFFTALLECRPGKRVDDGVDAGGLVVSICNPPCCSALDFFCSFYIVCRMWVPDSGRVLQDWADKAFICCFFGFLVSDF